MIEKTFVEESLTLPLAAKSNKVKDNSIARFAALSEKRNRVYNYIAVSLNVSRDKVSLVEGLDIWDANMGRYYGEAEVLGQQYKFDSQSYKSGEKVLTHFVLIKK